MTTIVHLSDLHFGRVEPAVVEALPAAVARDRPHLVVVSGDLTQRARRSQFAAARRFLDQLPSPRLVVPGNHDVPLYDVVRRFLAPLRRYRRMIDDDLTPTYVDDALVVRGVNTARATTTQGRIARGDIDALERWFVAAGEGRLRVLVAHHPFAPLAPGGHVVGRSADALVAAATACVDLILGGHLHVGQAPDPLAANPALGRRIVVPLAGTATSTRRRSEPNSNLPSPAGSVAPPARRQRDVSAAPQHCRWRIVRRRDLDDQGAYRCTRQGVFLSRSLRQQHWLRRRRRMRRATEVPGVRRG